jgi:hypothetical protein
METIYSSETSVDFQRTTRRIPEDSTLHNHRCENLKSYLYSLYSVHEDSRYEALIVSMKPNGIKEPI